jgi:hypothetical protein
MRSKETCFTLGSTRVQSRSQLYANLDVQLLTFSAQLIISLFEATCQLEFIMFIHYINVVLQPVLHFELEAAPSVHAQNAVAYVNDWASRR